MSYPALVRLSAAPRWVLGVATAVFFLGGVVAPRPWGPALLGVVAVFLAWLLALAWPRLAWTLRLTRLAVVLTVAIFVGLQAAGRI